jgi:hypothetical protein
VCRRLYEPPIPEGILAVCMGVLFLVGSWSRDYFAGGVDLVSGGEVGSWRVRGEE